MNHHTSLAAVGMMAALTAAPFALAQDEAADKPTAQQIVGRAMGAMASEETFSTLMSLSHSTTMPAEFGMGAVAVQTIFPLHFRVDAETPEGEAMLCSNGEHTWSIEPGGTGYDIDDPEVPVIAIMFSPYVQFGTTMIHMMEELEYHRDSEFGGATCHEVEIDGKHKHPISRLFFNAETGLPAGMRVTGPDGEDAEIIFKEFADAGGVQMVTTATMSFGPEMVVDVKFGDFVWNKVEESAFAMPAEVKKELDEDHAHDDDAHDHDDDGDGHSHDDD